MALPVPNLDDRRFQQLVDDAKRLVQQRCPEWTDHNVSDPGVTLIETFAYMVDQLLYRVNRIPDRNYVTFLDLIGVRMFPPTAARADVTFWLVAPMEETVRIAEGVQVGTSRTASDEAVVFTVVEERAIPPSSVAQLRSTVAEHEYRVHDETLARQQRFACFDDPPKPGDALLVGLDVATPGCAVSLDLDCAVEGVGVDPRFPPLVWEAWTGEEWVACEVERDETGGLNRAGEVVLHVPREHDEAVIDRERAGWLRCRLVEPWEDQPFYRHSPTVGGVEAATVGATTQAVNAEVVEEEVVGLSEGLPGQRFPVSGAPIVPGDTPATLEVAAGDGWETWTAVESFADSREDDRHFVLDAAAGEVLFGPQIRLPDGSVRQYGAVPPKATPLRLREYRTGGGVEGNVASGALSVLKTSVPFVGSVRNRRPATGGVDGETLDNAKLRGPIVMRTRGRAVTVEDYEELAHEAAHEVARVRCARAGSEGTEAGGVRILVVPAADESEGRLRFEQLLPSEETLQRISDTLEERRLIGARVVVEPPVYQGVTVVARVRARPGAVPTRLERASLDALYGFLNPVRGGSEGTGWPFGRPVHIGEVYATLQRLDGVEFVEDVTLFPADPVSGERGEPSQRIDLGEHALVFSYEHSVRIES